MENLGTSHSKATRVLTRLVITALVLATNALMFIYPSSDRADKAQAVTTGYDNVFLINDVRDVVDSNPGDGVCATRFSLTLPNGSAAASCTLYAAIQEANALTTKKILVGVAEYIRQLNGSFSSTGAIKIDYNNSSNPSPQATPMLTNGPAMNSQVGAYANSDQGAMYWAQSSNLTIDLQSRISFYADGNTASRAIIAFTGNNQVLRNFANVQSSEGGIYVGSTAQNLTIENGKISNPAGAKYLERGIVVVAGSNGTRINNVVFDNLDGEAIDLLVSGTKTIQNLSINRSQFLNDIAGSSYHAIRPFSTNAVKVSNMKVRNSTFSNWDNSKRPLQLQYGNFDDLDISYNLFQQSRLAFPSAIYISVDGIKREITHNKFVYNNSASVTGGNANSWIWTELPSGKTARVSILDNSFDGPNTSPQMSLGSNSTNTITVARNTMTGVGGLTTNAVENISSDNQNVKLNLANKQMRTVYPSQATVVNNAGVCTVNVTIQKPSTTDGGNDIQTNNIIVDFFFGRIVVSGGDGKGLEQYLKSEKMTISSLPKTVSIPVTSVSSAGVIRLQTTEESSNMSSQISRAVAVTGNDTCAPNAWIKQSGWYSASGTITTNQQDPSYARTMYFDVKFSEPLASNSLSTSDFVLNGSATGKQVNEIIQVSSTEYLLKVSAQTSGTVTPDLLPGSVQDGAGNIINTAVNSQPGPIEFTGYTDTNQTIPIAGANIDRTVTYNVPLAVTSGATASVAEPGTIATNIKVQNLSTDVNGFPTLTPSALVTLKPVWSNLISDPNFPNNGQVASNIAEVKPNYPSISLDPIFTSLDSYVDYQLVAKDNLIADGTRKVTLGWQVISADPNFDGIFLRTTEVTVLDNDTVSGSNSLASVMVNNSDADGVAKNSIQLVTKNTTGQNISYAPADITIPSGITYVPSSGSPVNGPSTIRVFTGNGGTGIFEFTSIIQGASFQISVNSVDNIAFTGSPLTLNFASIPANVSNSSYSVSTGNVVANGLDAHTLEVVLKTNSGLAASGWASNLSATPSLAGATVSAFSEVVGTPGTYRASVTSTNAGISTFQVLYNSVAILNVVPATNNSASFIAGEVDATKSTVAITSGTRIANGTDEHTLTVTLKDANNNLISGKQGQLSIETLANLSGNSLFTEVSNGVYEAKIRTQNIGIWNLTPKYTNVNTINLNTVSAEFVVGPVDLAMSSYELSTGDKIVGQEVHTVTIKLRDSLGRPVANQEATISTTAIPVLAGPYITGVNGNVTVDLSQTIAGAYPVMASYNGNNLSEDNGATHVNFIAGAPYFGPGGVSISATGGSVVANNLATHRVTVTVKDMYGNLVPNANVQFVIPGALNPQQAVTQITSNSGVVFLDLATTIAGAYSVSATVNSIALGSVQGAPVSVTYGAGSASYSNSTVEIDNNLGVTADNIAGHTVTATIRDANNNPVANSSVSVVLPTGLATQNQITVNTDSNGKAAWFVTSIKAGGHEVEVLLGSGSIGSVTANYVAGTPSAANSELIASAGSRIADGVDSHSLNVIVRDAYNNPVQSATVDLIATSGSLSSSSIVTNAMGEAVAYLTSTQATTINVNAQIGGADIVNSPASMLFVPGVISYQNSIFEVTPGGSVVADGVSAYTLKATLRDAFNNSISGQNVVFTIPSIWGGAQTVVSNGSGVAQYLLSTTKAGSSVVYATVASIAITGSGNLNFIAGDPYFGNGGSRIDGTIGSVIADGLSTHNVTATVVDVFGNPVPGVNVSFDASSDLVFSGNNIITGPNGIVSVTAATTKSGVYSVNATVNSIAVTQGAPVSLSYVSGSPNINKTLYELVTVNDTKIANGQDAHLLRVTVLDSYNNPVPSVNVSFSSISPIAYSANGVSNAQGIVEVPVTSTVAGTFNVAASIGSDQLQQSPLAMTFVSGPLDLSKTVFNLTGGAVTADGVATHRVDVYLYDSFSNPISGLSVDFSGDNSSVMQTPSVLTDSNGKASSLITSIVAGDKSITANYGNDLLGSGTVRFVSDEISLLNSSITVTPVQAVTADGVQKKMIEITLRDVNNNPVVGEGVGLAYPSSLVVAANGLSVSNSSGKIYFDAVTTVAGVYPFTASIGTDAIGTVFLAYISGDFSPSQSMFSFNKTRVSTQSPDKATATVILKDAYGNFISDATNVYLVPSVGSEILLNNLGSGSYSTDVTSSNAGVITYGYRVGLAQGNQQISVEFVDPPAAPTLYATDGSFISGKAVANTTLKILDETNTVVAALLVDSNGDFNYTFVNKYPDGYELKAYVIDDLNAFSPTSSVIVDDLSDNLDLSKTQIDVDKIKISVAPGWVSNVTLKLFRQDGQPYQISKNVEFTNDLGSIITNGSNLALGEYYGVFSSTQAGIATISAKVDSTQLSQDKKVLVLPIPDGLLPDVSNGRVVTGIAPSADNMRVDFYLNGNFAIGSGMVGPLGVFSIQLDGGPYISTSNITARLVDELGVESNPVAVKVIGDKTPPPVFTTTTVDDISGRGIPGYTVMLTFENGVNTTVVVAPDGTWSLIVPVSADIQNKSVVKAVQYSPSTEISDEVQSVVDAQKPDTPVINQLTNSMIVGCAEPGSTVTISLINGTVLGVVQADANCRFELSFTNPISVGTQVEVYAVDASGNKSDSAFATVTKAPPRVELSAEQIYQGQVIIATGYGFEPNEDVSGLLQSEPINLGTKKAASDGTVSFEIVTPQDFELTTHKVTLTGSLSGAGSDTFLVVTAPVANTTLVVASPKGLSYTGSNSGLGLLIFASVFIASGYFISRRKNA